MRLRRYPLFLWRALGAVFANGAVIAICGSLLLNALSHQAFEVPPGLANQLRHMLVAALPPPAAGDGLDPAADRASLPPPAQDALHGNGATQEGSSLRPRPRRTPHVRLAWEWGHQAGTLVQQASKDMDGVAFDGVSLGISSGGRLVIGLDNLVVVNRAPLGVLHLHDVEIALSLWALLGGGNMRPDKLRAGLVQADVAWPDSTAQPDQASAMTGAPFEAVLAPLMERFMTVQRRPELRELQRIEIDTLNLRITRRGQKAPFISANASLMLHRQTQDAISGHFEMQLAEQSGVQGQVAADIGISPAGMWVDADVSDLWAPQMMAVAGGGMSADGGLAVPDVPISAQFNLRTGSNGRLAPFPVKLHVGPGGLPMGEGRQPVRIEGAQARAVFDPASRTLDLQDVEFSVGGLKARAQGAVQLNPASADNLFPVTAQLRLYEISGNPRGLLEAPVEVKQLELDLAVATNPLHVRIDRGVVQDPGLHGRFSGTFRAASDGWEYLFEGSSAQLSIAKTVSAWPLAVTPLTRKWIKGHIFGGDIRDVHYSISGHTSDKFPAARLRLDFDNAHLSVIDALPNVSELRGRLTIAENRMQITSDVARMTVGDRGEVVLDGSSVVIADVRRSRGVVEFGLNASAPLELAIKVADRLAPGALPLERGFVDDLKGMVTLAGDVIVPLHRPESGPRATFDLSGKITDAGTGNVLSGHKLVAKTLNLDLDNQTIMIAGEGVIAGFPVAGTWQITPGAVDTGSRVEAKVALSGGDLRSIAPMLLPGMVSGAGVIHVILETGRKAPVRFQLASDLAGLGIELPFLGWGLAPAEQGELEISGTLGSEPEIDLLSFAAPGLHLVGALQFTREWQLNQARFDMLELGDQAKLQLRIGRDANDRLDITLNGGEIDLRHFNLADFGGRMQQTSSVNSPDNPNPVIGLLSAKGIALRLTDRIVLDDLNGGVDRLSPLTGQFRAKVNGNTPVIATVGEQSTVISKDAGGVLQDAGLLAGARGGEMRLHIDPVKGEDDTYAGSVEISNLRVIDAPLIAELLNAISVVGLLERLGTEGINFSRIEVVFKVSPRQFEILKARATSPSLAITFAGKVDAATSRLDFHGVVSPLFVINAIGAIFGDPGKGLIGFDYWIDGNVSAPEVRVNPVPIPLPGIFSR